VHACFQLALLVEGQKRHRLQSHILHVSTIGYPYTTLLLGTQPHLMAVKSGRLKQNLKTAIVLALVLS